MRTEQSHCLRGTPGQLLTAAAGRFGAVPEDAARRHTEPELLPAARRPLLSVPQCVSRKEKVRLQSGLARSQGRPGRVLETDCPSGSGPQLSLRPGSREG